MSGPPRAILGARDWAARQRIIPWYAAGAGPAPDVLLDDFSAIGGANGWEAVLSTAEYDTEHVITGPRSIALTVDNNGFMQKSLTVRGDQLVRLRFYLPDLETVNNLYIQLRIGGDWNNNVSYVAEIGGLSEASGPRGGPGWRTITCNPFVGNLTGIPSDTDRESLVASAIRIRLLPRTGETGTVVFDEISQVENRLSRGTVTITFDDGHATDRTIAAQIMADRGLRGVAYVTGQWGSPGLMTLAQMRELQDDFGWDVVTHGWAQTQDLDTPEEVEAEFGALYDALEAEGFNKAGLRHMSLPYGNLNSLTRQFLPTLFSTARSTQGSSGHYQIEYVPPGDQFFLRRVLAQESVSLNNFENTLQLINETRGWGVIMFHEITETGSGGGGRISQAKFVDFMDAIVDSGVAVRTLSQMNQYFPFPAEETIWPPE